MKKPYDLVVYIGRFQPFHEAHAHTINYAGKNLADNILVIVGSKNSPRTPKNPFTFTERKSMIEHSIQLKSLKVVGVGDYVYDDSLWIKEVGNIVNEYAKKNNLKKIAVIGYDKDHSSYYLNYFPQWTFVPIEAYPEHGETIDATKIRDLYFKGDFSFIKSVLPERVSNFVLGYFAHTDEYQQLKEEWEFIQDYKRMWSVAPYPPIFVTVDAVVVQSGHILLIKRGGNPGKGKWAMPGGFVSEHEKIEDAVIRELREETRLKVPEKVLKGSIKHKEVFDAPDRSSRGRTITHVFLIHFDDSMELPKVKGSDDAKDAKWIPLSELEHMEPVMNEDHWHIINHMLNQM